MTKQHQTRWQRWLNEHDQLVKRTTASVYDRIKILTKVHGDPAYHAAMKAAAKSPFELLNMRIRDTCLSTFGEALAILRMFPRKAQWDANSLYDLQDKWQRNQLEQKRERDKAAETSGDGEAAGEGGSFEQTQTVKKDRDTATVAERKRLQAAMKDAQAEIVRLTGLLEEKDKRIADLEGTIQDLRGMNQLLAQRVESLEAVRE